MARIGCREVYFAKAMEPRRVDFLIDKVKEVVNEMGFPPEYDIRIYKNVYSCCGIGGLGVVIEVVGPEEEKIRALDLRAVSKIIEFCEQESHEIGYHSCEKHYLI
ncbi:hypothetical protein A3K79_04950 [Candidatus Bathyarchaeota archaeon RBG_13_46_16b]|nr:MAG: hypothetical protein A3K79_04950 [Candidatus Bathyarchaeota archaeon RBG_13_46_16b]